MSENSNSPPRTGHLSRLRAILLAIVILVIALLVLGTYHVAKLIRLTCSGITNLLVQLSYVARLSVIYTLYRLVAHRAAVRTALEQGPQSDAYLEQTATLPYDLSLDLILLGVSLTYPLLLCNQHSGRITLSISHELAELAQKASISMVSGICNYLGCRVVKLFGKPANQLRESEISAVSFERAQPKPDTPRLSAFALVTRLVNLTANARRSHGEQCPTLCLIDLSAVAIVLLVCNCLRLLAVLVCWGIIDYPLGLFPGKPRRYCTPATNMDEANFIGGSDQLTIEHSRTCVIDIEDQTLAKEMFPMHALPSCMDHGERDTLLPAPGLDSHVQTEEHGSFSAEHSNGIE